MKKILCACLVFLLVVVGIPHSFAAITISDETIINHANSLVGSTYTRGYCLEWVATKFWQALGAPYSSACCAYAHGNSHIASSSRENIPIGANVYFGGGTTRDQYNHVCGHIGVHIGNERIINLIHYKNDSENLSVVRINTISEILSWSTGYTYRGWGYPDGVTLDSTATFSNLEFRDVAYPKTFRINTSAGWDLTTGSIVSDVDLVSIQSILSKNDGSWSQDTGEIAISGKYYALSNINTRVKFSQITPAMEGDFTWTLIAKDKNRTLRMVMPFNAVNSGSTSTATKSLAYSNQDPDPYSEKPESVEIYCVETPMRDEVHHYILEDHAEVPLMGGANIPNVEVAWESSDPSVATAPSAESIYMKIVGVGTTVIKCYCVDYPDVFAKFTVEVTSNAPAPETWEYQVVTSYGLNVRTEASAGSTIVTTLFSPATITVTQKTTAGGYTWGYGTTSTGYTGWTVVDNEWTKLISGSGIPVDAVHFPDANFRAYVAANIDTDGNGMLSDQEIGKTEQIDVTGKSISDLTGIEYFTALTQLNCYESQLTALDVSRNTKLEVLDCYYNQLTDLDVSHNTVLRILHCGGNQMTTLDVSHNIALTSLYCSENQLTTLDVSANQYLEELYCHYNQLTSLDVSANQYLEKLDCHSNQLTSLDVSRNTALTKLYCDSNQLTMLDVSRNTALTKLYCDSNQLTMLDVSANQYLEELYCHYNQLTSLDVSANQYLEKLYCYSNQLTSLDVSRNTALTYLQCETNQLTVLIDKNEKFDLSALPGFDITKASNWNGGTVSGTILNVPASGEVTYTYDCGRGFSETFTLDITVTGTQAEGVPIDEAHFPDANFRAYVADYFDTDGNGMLSDQEIAMVTQIYFLQQNISDLTGIEYFTALTQLYCYESQLTALDVSRNTKLEVLGCSNNQLTDLDVSHNTVLTTLWCDGNQLTTLDVSHNIALTSLSCSENQLTTLDVSVNTALTSLSCDFNQLTTLDVSVNTALTSLSCGSNQLTTLDVSHNTALDHLFCNHNQLTTLDVSANQYLEELYCHSNQLTTLDVSRNTALTELSCGPNRLTSLNVSHLTALTKLDCDSNRLTTLDVSHNTALKELYCGGNQLTTLDVSQNTALRELHCFRNQLTTLDVSRNTKVYWLTCHGNRLTSLDVSRNTALTYLQCETNQQTVLIDKNEKFDLSVLPGFDITKASNWNGGTVSGTILTIPASGKVTYTYDCGRGFSETFTLDVIVQKVPIDAAHFPDANFRAFVSWAIDTDGNGILSDQEIGRAQWLDASGRNISDLTGIEYFTELIYIDCGDNQLTTLDVSHNTALEGLECYRNQLTTLDVSRNTALKRLYCGTNQLKSLDVSANTALTILMCGTNQLKTLDVSHNTALMQMGCSKNQLTKLDVSANTALTYLSCGINQLRALDVSANTALTELYCYDNQLTALDVSNCTDLSELECDGNQLTGMTAENGRFDLSTLPGFNATKASNWNGGTVSGTILTIPVSGKVTYTYDCGKGFSETFTLDVTVPAALPCPHENSTWQETKAATCTEPGEKKLICDACGETLDTQEIPALGHDWGETGYTWTRDNLTVTAKRVCNRDNCHIETEQVSATAEIVAPTDAAQGMAVYSSQAFTNTAFKAQEKLIVIPALSQLKTLRLPSALKQIESEAFSNLTCQAVIIPDGCTSIGSRAFADCQNLLYVRIPASVTSIANDAFAGCDQAVIDRKTE